VGTTAVEQCPGGQVWNGGSCVTTAQCPAGEYWNGASCSASSSSSACASLDSRAAALTNELIGISARVRQACTQDPYGDECKARKQEQEGAVQRYRMLQGETAPGCRTLPDPLSLI